MLDKKDLIAIRNYDEKDKNFILATFLRNLYYDKGGWYSEIPKHIFMENYHRVIDKIMSYPNLAIRIACLKEDPEVILGYSIVREVDGKIVLDYIFVKTAWRRIGIGRSLVPKNLHSVTHLTKVGKILKPKDCDFNPFLI